MKMSRLVFRMLLPLAVMATALVVSAGPAHSVVNATAWTKTGTGRIDFQSYGEVFTIHDRVQDGKYIWLRIYEYGVGYVKVIRGPAQTRSTYDWSFPEGQEFLFQACEGYSTKSSIITKTCTSPMPTGWA